VETLRWSAAVKEWDGSFATSVAHSPDPQRSRREWERLRAQLTNGSALAKLLAAPGSVAHAEMPFLWALSGQECLDGIIDLAVHDPATGAWVILDWKTNRASADELAGLREHYRPQLSAYWKAAREMLQAPVVAGLYATGEGRWLPYSEAELAGTWEKLKGNPADLARVMEEERGD
jgi:ATP-dependent exoDNAse (exonuclease V) beta subunit